MSQTDPPPKKKKKNIYTYIYICIYTHTYIYIYIHANFSLSTVSRCISLSSAAVDSLVVHVPAGVLFFRYLTYSETVQTCALTARQRPDGNHGIASAPGILFEPWFCKSFGGLVNMHLKECRMQYMRVHGS